MFLHKQHKRENQRSYTYYSIAESFRVGKKTKKRILCRLGKLSEQKANQIRLILKFQRTEEVIVTVFENIIFEKHWKYLDLAVLNHFWEQWELSPIFKDKDPRIKVETKNMAKILTLNRCLDPGIKSFFSCKSEYGTSLCHS